MIPLILGDPPALPSEKHLSDSARPPLAVEARKEVPGCWLKSKTVLYLSLFDKIIFAPFNWYVKKKKKSLVYLKPRAYTVTDRSVCEV